MTDSLPEYKKQYLATVKRSTDKDNDDDLNLQQFQVQTKEVQINTLTKVTNTNDIWESGQYADPEWRNYLNSTYYRSKHNQKEFDVNEKVNPEIADKRFNMRATQISEYSNAMHNNRVFVNPKFDSC